MSGGLLLGLVGGALIACSAGGGSGGGFSGSGGQGGAAGFGNTANAAGFGNTGNVVGAGSTTTDPGGFGGFGATGGDPGTGGGGPVGDAGVSVGLYGPPVINKCGDTSPFQGGGALKVLYPYDGTVFPRGLSGPLVMWDGGGTDILIQANSKDWSYTECAQVSNGRFQFPDDPWKGAGSYSGGPGDPLTVKVTVKNGGTVVGSATFTLKFALATLKGAIYYNTYGVPNFAKVSNGAVMKVVPGGVSSVFLTDQGLPPMGPCRSCHALSANGTVMTANHHNYVPGAAAYISEVYDVAGNTPTLVKDNIFEAGFAGIFPDGSRMVTNGPPNPSQSVFFPGADGNVPALVQSTSKMLNPKDGSEIPMNGWDAPHAQMPMFSPDGRRIVYNDYDKGQGHSLWLADFDPATNTFSGQRQIFNDPQLYAAWPFFTPDSQQVVFATDTRPDYATQLPNKVTLQPLDATGRGHLMLIDLATGTVTPLDLANGFRGGQSYLPAGVARDNNLEFFPTVSPIAGGGYAWVLFTSRRTYGNLTSGLGLEDPTTKKIWVSAVAMGAPAGTDPSNPPFLLPGQDIETGNLRAFAALEPCKEDGQACESGTECCKGYCSVDPQSQRRVCGKFEVQQCSRVDDLCVTDDDCCKGSDNGVGGRILYCLDTAGRKICTQKTIN